MVANILWTERNPKHEFNDSNTKPKSYLDMVIYKALRALLNVCLVFFVVTVFTMQRKAHFRFIFYT